MTVTNSLISSLTDAFKNGANNKLDMCHFSK